MKYLFKKRSTGENWEWIFCLAFGSKMYRDGLLSLEKLFCFVLSDSFQLEF